MLAAYMTSDHERKKIVPNKSGTYVGMGVVGSG